MKVDFHFHTCITKTNPIDLNFFQQSVLRAREQDLGAIMITDHHDGPNFEGIYAALDQNYPYNGDYYLVDEVRYYPGVEVAIQEGPHLLVSGQRDSVLTFYDRLRPHLSPETYPTLEEFFTLQTGLDLLNIFAHPLRLGREIERVDPALLSGFDALDLNAKDVRRYGAEGRRRVEQFGRKYDLHVVAGSDSHHFYQLGCLYNEFHRPFETISDLRRLIYAGAYTITVQPNLGEWVTTANALKRAVKESLNLLPPAAPDTGAER